MIACVYMLLQYYGPVCCGSCYIIMQLLCCLPGAAQGLLILMRLPCSSAELIPLLHVLQRQCLQKRLVIGHFANWPEYQVKLAARCFLFSAIAYNQVGALAPKACLDSLNACLFPTRC
eukprot:scpid44089/ scgid7962/ 